MNKEVRRMDQLNAYHIRQTLQAPVSSPDVTKLSVDLVRTIQKHHVNYDKAKEALDYTNQVLLNKLLNKTTI